MSSFDADVETDASTSTQRLVETARRLRAVRAARRRFLFLWAIESDAESCGGRFAAHAHRRDVDLRPSSEPPEN
jgi:hypothetical protein